MTTPLTFERRMELVERDERDLADLIAAQSRQPQGLGKRWTHWALTTLPYVGSYPGDGTNTFPIRFCEPTYTPTAGAQTLLAQPNSTQPVTVARTTNGQWCMPGEIMMASPIPPPHGTTGKGRWLITPVKTYYYGLLSQELTRLGSALVDVHIHGPAGTWTDTGYDLTVLDSGFLAAGQKLPIGTWVRFEWSRVAWVVTHYFGLGRLARAKLSYDLCGGDTADVDNFEFLLGGTLAAPPTTVSNLFHHRGRDGDWVLLAETTLHASGWLLIDVEKHAYKVFTDLRQTGACEHWCVEGLAITAALEVCGPAVWETVYCDPCGELPQTSGVFQTSVSSSVPTYGCCIDDSHVSDLGIATTDAAGNEIPYSLTPLPLYATLTTYNGVCEYDPGGGAYSIRTITPRTGDVNADLIWPAGGPIQSAELFHPLDPGPYLWPQYESWGIQCRRRRDPLTKTLLFPDDPSQREWSVFGSWGISGQGSGSGTQGFIEIFETGVAVVESPPGSTRFLIPASLQVLSCNPFHAIAHFEIPQEHTSNGNSFVINYPTVWNNCGPTTLELTE